MENKGKKIASSLAIFTLIGGASVLHAFVSKITKSLLYRYHKSENTVSILESVYNGKSVFIKNKQNLKLHGVFIEEENANKTLIILHPFGLEAKDMGMFVAFFKKKIQNCNILLIDARSHGQSDGYIRGFGSKDVDDLVLWTKYIQKQFGDEHPIILYGKELGANTALNAAGKHQIHGVKAIISDGAYTSVYDILGDRLVTDYKVAKFPALRMIRRKICKEAKIDIKESTVDLVTHNDIPTLYVHTKHDDFVPLKHVYPLYNGHRGKKELFVLKDERYLYDLKETDDYTSIFTTFINKYIN